MLRAVRIVTSALLLALGAAALAGAITAHWLDTVLLDTDTFIEAADHVLRDPATQGRTAERISSAILTRIDVRSLAESNLPSALRPLAEKVASDFEELVSSQVAAAVRTSAFASLTRSRLRTWHRDFSSAIVARDQDLSTDGSLVTVTLGPYIDLLSDETEAPLMATLLGLVPQQIRQAEVAVFNTRPLMNRFGLLRALHGSAPYLPWLAAAALVAGVIIAPRRGYALAGAALAVASTGVALLVAISAEKERVVESLGTSLGASDAALALAAGTLAEPLERWTEQMMWLGLALALACAVSFLYLRLFRRYLMRGA